MKPGDLKFFDPAGQDIGGNSTNSIVNAMANMTSPNGTAAGNVEDDVSTKVSYSISQFQKLLKVVYSNTREKQREK